MSTEKWRTDNRDRMLEYRRRWYENNKLRQIDRMRSRKRELRAWVSEIKTSLACETCHEDHPSCLVFHHKNPSEKEISLSAAITNGWARGRMLTEIAKCQVLCENCHRKLHHPTR